MMHKIKSQGRSDHAMASEEGASEEGAADAHSRSGAKATRPTDAPPSGTASAGSGDALDANAAPTHAHEGDTATVAATADAGSEADRLREQLLRLAADFDNFRKRSQKDLDDQRRFGINRLLTDLLPVLDNLERALAHAPAGSQDPVLQGVTMVTKQWQDVLGQYGVKKIASDGTRFDPERHEAVGQEASPTKAPGTVLAELQCGYMIHDRLLRPARVMVADQGSGRG